MGYLAACNETTVDCTLPIIHSDHSLHLPLTELLLSIFSLIFVVHLIQGIAWRTWVYTAVMGFGCFCSVFGYSGRVILHSNPSSYEWSIVQSIFVNITPLFFASAIFLSVSRLMETFGSHLARIQPAPFADIFLTCNILPLAFQTAGSVLASEATYYGTDSSLGNDILTAGFSFQILNLLLFGTLCVEFANTVNSNPAEVEDSTLRVRSTKRFRFFIAVLVFAYFCILVRCIYRVMALSVGGDGGLNSQTYLFLFEGLTILAAGYGMALVHPGYVFQQTFNDEEGREPNEKEAYAPTSKEMLTT